MHSNLTAPDQNNLFTQPIDYPHSTSTPRIIIQKVNSVFGKWKTKSYLWLENESSSGILFFNLFRQMARNIITDAWGYKYHC